MFKSVLYYQSKTIISILITTNTNTIPTQRIKTYNNNSKNKYQTTLNNNKKEIKVYSIQQTIMTDNFNNDNNNYNNNFCFDHHVDKSSSESLQNSKNNNCTTINQQSSIVASISPTSTIENSTNKKVDKDKQLFPKELQDFTFNDCQCVICAHKNDPKSQESIEVAQKIVIMDKN
jgi:hypothetical protein